MNEQFVHTQLYPMNCQVLSSPNRRACLVKFFRFSFHPARNFSCNNWKIPPLIYLVNKWACSIFFQPCLFIPVCSSIRDFRVLPKQPSTLFPQFVPALLLYTLSPFITGKLISSYFNSILLLQIQIRIP